MNDDTMLPADDRDRALARHLAGDAEPPADPADHALADALHAYRAAHDAEAPSEETSARIWAGIEPGLGTDRAPRRARVFRLPVRWLAAAAAVVVLAALGWWLFALPPAPTLLAAADADALVYTTDDGSTITLRPHSRLYALAGEEAETRLHLVGEAFFDVTENPARTFAVEANGARVSVLGTRFDVSTWGGQTAVYLERGRVRFTYQDRSVVLAPGQRSLVTEEGVLVDPAPADSAEFLDWLRRDLTFVQRPLRLIVAELEQHYAVTLDVPAPLLVETLTGHIPLTEPAQSLRDLGLALGGRFVPVAEKRYRFEED